MQQKIWLLQIQTTTISEIKNNNNSNNKIVNNNNNVNNNRGIATGQDARVTSTTGQNTEPNSSYKYILMLHFVVFCLA